jgi:hypothetical protein
MDDVLFLEDELHRPLLLRQAIFFIDSKGVICTWCDGGLSLTEASTLLVFDTWLRWASLIEAQGCCQGA